MNIEVNNLTKSFKEFKLNDVSMHVGKGKIVGLIGENGAGKTTLIKCILGVQRIDEGSIKLFGKPIDSSLLDDVGVVLDESFVNLKYNVSDVNLMMKHIYKNWDEDMFFKFMNTYNIPLKKELKKLSTGMKKKVEISAALSHHPKLLILDEPTSGLDPIVRSEILDSFQEFINNQENSILISTHITTDLEHIADEVVFINEGSIVFEDSLSNINSTYSLLILPKEEFNSFDKELIIRYKENKNDYLVLINKNNLSKEYKKYVSKLTLDDLMLLYVRGVSCAD